MMITLHSDALAEDREFTIDHATALLSYEQERGMSNWVIPENSEYTFRNGTIERADKKADKKPGQRQSVAGGS